MPTVGGGLMVVEVVVAQDIVRAGLRLNILDIVLVVVVAGAKVNGMMVTVSNIPVVEVVNRILDIF